MFILLEHIFFFCTLQMLDLMQPIYRHLHRAMAMISF